MGIVPLVTLILRDVLKNMDILNDNLNIELIDPDEREKPVGTNIGNAFL